MISEYETINTFHRRPVPAQMITYLMFFGEALTFFICMYVNYTHLAKQIAILILYIITMIAQIILTVLTSCSDPSDDMMIEYRNNVSGRYCLTNFRRNMNVDDCLYCDICTSYVKESSRHCKVCQRYPLMII